MQAKLTKTYVDRATYQGNGRSKDFRRDTTKGSPSGFALRIYPSGRKSFVLAYKLNGRDRLYTLGEYGALTVEEARSLAKTKAGELVGGTDPLEERRKAARGETIADLCQMYMERHGSLKKSSADDQRRITRHILPAWRNLKAQAIKRADVAAVHAKIGRTAPYEANRVVALLSKMFELARLWGFVPEEQANPARDIDRFKEQKRDRWVTPEELPRLAQAINEEPNQSARVALWLYLLTGARKSELLRAQWKDVDWGRRELRMPETKVGRVHYVPLSAPALALLEQMPRESDNPYVFPGRVACAPLVNIDKPWQRVRKAAGVEDVRLHDLRRTVGSWLAQAGNSLHLIGKVLNHSNTSTTAVYARFGQDQVAEALEQHGERIMGTAGLSPTADVVQLQHANKTKT